MNIEIQAWMRGAVRIGTVLTVLVAIMAVPGWALEAEESEGSDAELISYGIDPQDFVGTVTVMRRVAANRVFYDTAFDTFDEESFIDVAVNPALRAETTPSFQEAAQQAGPEGGGGGVETGNDPRDFGGKVMPYYRFQELSNGMKTQDFTLFGMWAWSTKMALTYEFPFARRYDIRETAACDSLEETGECFGNVPGGGTPEFPRGFEGRGLGEITGVGDSIFRMVMNFDWELFGAGFLPGIDLTFPTATEPVLGGQSFVAGPIFTFVWDMPFWPAPGAFFAMMNILQFDVWKDPERDAVGRFFGRWFIQLPVQKSQMLYIMTEFQPLYDWKSEHFSLWIGPEFGKAFKPSSFFRNGGALYFKPGFGIKPKEEFGDRKWSFEFGFRYFLNPSKSVADLMAMAAGR